MINRKYGKCNHTYIGSTKRHLITRINEHKHKELQAHHIRCNNNTTIDKHFSLLINNITNYRRLLIMEALNIQHHKPYLNTVFKPKEIHHIHILKT